MLEFLKNVEVYEKKFSINFYKIFYVLHKKNTKKSYKILIVNEKIY
jgi:hypothetical protein